MPTHILLTILVLVQIISLALTLYLFKFYRLVSSLTKDDKKTLRNLLVGLQKTLSSHEKKLVSHTKEINKLISHTSFCIDKVLVKRFNPFPDTGGKHSFMLAFLDSRLTGIILTFLHTRENTRFYVKSIQEGEGKEFPLSPEEQKLIKSARKAS